MVDRPKKPAALATTPGLAPQPIVDISSDNGRVSARLPTGESIDILLYGATIISWKDTNGAEKLWLSDAAKLDGSKPVRGGIPLVFPVFGTAPSHAATSKLPQHGFARTSRWEFLGKSTSESAPGRAHGDSGVSLDFGLSSSNLTEDAKKAWPYDFGLIYSVTLSRDGLETSILVRNEGETAWDFQVLLHTYLKVDDITKTSVTGLSGATYVDKVGGPTTKTESSKTVTITGETDRVYSTPGAADSPLMVVSGSKPAFSIVRDNLEDAVVWNPWTEKAEGMADFAPKDGFKHMLCVEAGQVSKWVKLEAGETFEGGQIIKALL